MSLFLLTLELLEGFSSLKNILSRGILLTLFFSRLSEWMGEAGCTITHLTPAMGQLLTANAYAQMPQLRLAFFVGDVLTKVG